MPYFAEMQTVAQIAIGVAGFAGIAIAVRPSDAKESSAGDYARTRELVLASLGVVFFALLPSLSEGFFGAGGWAWRAPQLLFGAYQASLMALFFASIRPGEIKGLERILTVLGVAVILLQLLTGFGYLNEYLEEAYYLALLWLLLVAAFDFAAIILRRGPV